MQPMTDRAKKISKIDGEKEYHIVFPKTKFELISSILCRWWYHFEDPYKDFKIEILEENLKS